MTDCREAELDAEVPVAAAVESETTFEEAGAIVEEEEADTTSVSGGPLAHSSNKHEMYSIFQSWALQNYGEAGKTKTVTSKKYNRIVRTLAGEEQPTSENSKFRFWVKAKGFKLGPPPPDEQTDDDQVLYVPTKIVVSKFIIKLIIIDMIMNGPLRIDLFLL